LRHGATWPPRRQRDVVEIERAGLAGCLHHLAVHSAQRKSRNRGERHAALDRVAHVRQRFLAVVQHDGCRLGNEERLGIGGGRVAADDDRHLRRQRANAPDEVHDLVGFERVHRGDAHQRRTRPADLRGDR
jgi:hypothetical protein